MANQFLILISSTAYVGAHAYVCIWVCAFMCMCTLYRLMKVIRWLNSTIMVGKPIKLQAAVVAYWTWLKWFKESNVALPTDWLWYTAGTIVCINALINVVMVLVDLELSVYYTLCWRKWKLKKLLISSKLLNCSVSKNQAL